MFSLIGPAAVLVAVLVQASPPMTEDRFRATIVFNASFNDRRFVRSGFTPIADAASQRRDIKRLQVSAGLLGAPPAMEMERHRNGQVVLTMRWPDRPAQRRSVAPKVWRRLGALELALYAMPSFDPRHFVKPTWSSCHGDAAAFQATSNGVVRQAGADQCRNSPEVFDDAKRETIAIFAREALVTRPDCPPSVAPTIQTLADCFRS